MSILRDTLGNFIPHFLSRRVSGSLTGLNAELVLDVDGDESACIFIDGGGGNLNTTFAIEGSVDGTNYGSLLAYINPLFSVGTSQLAGQPLVIEAVNATSVRRKYSVACGQLKKIRLRLSAWSAGTCYVTIISDTCQSMNPFVRDQRAATLFATTTAAPATNTATTIVCPAYAYVIWRISAAYRLGL